MRDRRAGVQIASTIGERILRDVDDAEDLHSPQTKREAVASLWYILRPLQCPGCGSGVTGMAGPRGRPADGTLAGGGRGASGSSYGVRTGGIPFSNATISSPVRVSYSS